MVGVAGKYKGCHTCRERRVPCDNVRPECLRCKKANRECKGYEKQTRFVLSGLGDGGRCSLQPPRKIIKPNKTPTRRNTKSSKMEGMAESSSHVAVSSTPSSPGLGKDKVTDYLEALMPRGDGIVVDPLQSAWDVYASISQHDTKYFPRVVALHTKLDQLQTVAVGQGDRCMIHAPTLAPPEITPSPNDEEFQVKARCLLHLSPHDAIDDFLGQVQTNSYCFFVYEQNSTMTINRYDPPWKYGANDPNSIRSQGPERFKTFPAHQFFARIYRPNTIYTALLNRKPVFLAENEWMTTPWDVHQKTHLDTLFDFIVPLAAIFHRTDRVLSQPPTYKRRLEAEDLLSNCQSIERTLREWHDMVVLTISQYSAPSSVQSSPRSHASRSSTPAGHSSSSVTSPSPAHSELESVLPESSHLLLAPTNPYWIERQELVGVEAQFPFQEQYLFKDGHTSLAFIHYWTSQVLLFRCIAQLHSAIVQPAISPPSVQHHIAHSGFQSVLSGYGIPSTPGHAYPMPSNTNQSMMGMNMIPGMMGMQHADELQQLSHSPPLGQMPQLQPPSIYNFGPGVTMGDMAHMGHMSGVGMSTIPAPVSGPHSPTTPPLGRTVDVGVAHCGVADPSRYSDISIKELAGEVCKSLGYALVYSTANLHPDTLACPLAVVDGFYKELRSRGHNVELEIGWCGWFRQKIIQRKTEIEHAVLREREWTDGGSW